MLEELERLDDDSRTLSGGAVFALSDTELTGSVDLVQVLVGRLVAVQAMLVREVSGRGLVRASGCANVSTWLRGRARISIAEAHKVTALGKLFDACPEVAAAVVSGECAPEQALVIGRTLADLPAAAGPVVAGKATATMLDFARRFEPAELRRLGDRVLAHVDPELADRVLRRRLDHDEDLARRERYLTLSGDVQGRIRLSGVLDVESAATVRAALEPLMAPVPTGPAGADQRMPAARRADALVEVCRLALRTGELPADGGQPPQVNVTINYAALAAAVGGGTLAGAFGSPAVGAGTLDTGEWLSVAAVRRMACDARILPVVLDGAGVPIDVGRARRLYTGAARAAVMLRDRGCAFPGCDRPPRWCDVHHRVSWLDGGRTDLGNGVALCGFHHRLVHRDAWLIVMGIDGRPSFIPPVHIDPDQQSRRNPYHQRT